MVNLLGLPSALDYVIIGSVIFFGVFLDMMGQRIVDFFKRIGGSMRKAVDPKVGGTSP
jgi:phosphate/sulfate permease